MAKFEKGQSGNPSGRPKLPEELRDRFRGMSDAAADVLEECLRDPDPHVRIKAAAVIFDRGWGKPAQTTDLTLTTKQDASQEHLQALLETARVRQQQPIDLGRDSLGSTPKSKVNGLN